jgi:hypothetical protein
MFLLMSGQSVDERNGCKAAAYEGKLTCKAGESRGLIYWYMVTLVHVAIQEGAVQKPVHNRPPDEAEEHCTECAQAICTDTEHSERLRRTDHVRLKKIVRHRDYK